MLEVDSKLGLHTILYIISYLHEVQPPKPPRFALFFYFESAYMEAMDDNKKFQMYNS